MRRRSIAIALDSGDVESSPLARADSPAGVDDAILTPGVRVSNWRSCSWPFLSGLSNPRLAFSMDHSRYGPAPKSGPTYPKTTAGMRTNAGNRLNFFRDSIVAFAKRGDIFGLGERSEIESAAFAWPGSDSGCIIPRFVGSSCSVQSGRDGSAFLSIRLFLAWIQLK